MPGVERRRGKGKKPGLLMWFVVACPYSAHTGIIVCGSLFEIKVFCLFLRGNAWLLRPNYIFVILVCDLTSLYLTTPKVN